MTTKCFDYYLSWEKYCKDKHYNTFSVENNFCSTILQKYNECILKNQYNK